MAIVLTQPAVPPILRPILTCCKSLPISQLSLPTPTSPIPPTPPITQTLPRLPPELHLQIIDTIAARIPHTPTRDEPYDPRDLSTLCACALVCKLWLSTARAGIWAKTRLSSRARSMALVALLAAYAPGDRAASFGPHIAHISLRETRGCTPWDPKWLNDALPGLAPHLTRVQSLDMERVTWEYLSSRSRTACLRGFKGVRKLSLWGCSFHTSREMCGFLAEFEELEVLTLDGVDCAKMDTMRGVLDWGVGGERTVRPPSRKLREVGLRGAPMESVLEWIMAGLEYQREVGKVGPGITSLRLGGVGVLEADVVGRFLREIGASLRKVHIGFDTDFVNSGDALVSQIDLGQNASLEEFHIFGLVVPSPPPIDPFDEEPVPPPTTLTQLTSLLSRIQSPMRVLSLALYPADLRATETIDCEGLARVFAKPTWAGLEEVRIVISNKESGLGRAVRERLIELHRRGVLKVNKGFDEREVL